MDLLVGRTRRWILLMAALATTAGCRDTSPTELRTPPTAPSKVISDGAHGGCLVRKGVHRL